MKYSVVAHSSMSEREAEALPEDPISVRSLAIVTGAVNHVGRNEILHLLFAAIMTAAAITAIS